MATNIKKKRLLDRIQDSIQQEGLTARTKASRKWLMDKVREMRLNPGAKRAFVNASKNSQTLPSVVTGIKGGLSIGKMYFFFYDPKTKEKLPYYDTLPLVIPVDYVPKSKSASKQEDGFLGLNLHYIHPKYRFAILDKLDIYDNNYDERTRFRLSYQWLKSNQHVFEATPCLKWYLFSHVQSRFLEIPSPEWEIAAVLPFEQFKKQSQVRVWSQSRKQF